MLQGWGIAVLAIGYVGALFAVAWAGDRMSARMFKQTDATTGRPILYALSLGVFCTSWTFFGSVGLAATTGFDFIPVYIGPILMFALGWRVIRRVIRLSKRQNLTSIADFLAARYGKSQAVSAIVTIVAVVGALPYIALQLKAVVKSTEVLLGESVFVPVKLPELGFLELSFVVAVILAVFAVLFGTRHTDTTEHQSGLMLAVAAESVLKLAAFVVVGIFVVMSVFGGFDGLAGRTWINAEIHAVFGQPTHWGQWITVSFLSLAAVILLPRQFHVAVVENRSEMEIKRAAWLFPLYLVAINIFVIPIATAGLITLPTGYVEPDMYVLAVPMARMADVFTAIAYLGGLSAATAMVIVESVALSIMISNGLVVPLLLRGRLQDYAQADDLAPMLLNIRRVAICLIVLAGYLVHRTLGEVQGLAAIGLISFAAIAQLAPAFFGGLMWVGGTARGAIAGMVAGSLVFSYTLMLPWFIKAGFLSPELLTEGPFGIVWLRPQGLFYLNLPPLTHGVVYSIAVNILMYVAVSLSRQPLPVERAQAELFVNADLMAPPPTPSRAAAAAASRFTTTVTNADLQATATRYLGQDRAQRLFSDYAQRQGRAWLPHMEADLAGVRFTEHLLTSAIGAASSRLVMALLLSRSDAGSVEALQLLDVASEALHYNRDLLQSALDQVRHGLGVFDRDLRLICLNRQFGELLELPPGLAQIGVPMAEIVRYSAMRGDFGGGPVEHLIADRMYRLTATRETLNERVISGVGRILEIRTAAMPSGGLVATYSDITERVMAANTLATTNEILERRVAERTSELEVARTKADEANLDKTRFLAAASHDLLQPLNAARLYASSLLERSLDAKSADIAVNIDASLNSVEEIMTALIDLSRMDAGRLEAEYSAVPLDTMFATLLREYEPVAAKKGLELKVLPSTAWVETDRRLLRRVLQNLVSNAIKYTPSGAVLLGATARGDSVIVHVSDTGPGIDAANHALIFKEFQRLEEHKSMASGLGLGLSIVQRIGRVLGAEIGVTSELGRGSTFWIALPQCAAPAIRMADVAGVPNHGPIVGCVALCIDNEPDVLKGMRTLLEGWGVVVLTAASATQAVEVVRVAATPVGGKPGIRPNVVLADYHLDQGIGLDAIAAVRTELRADIPAIIITADHSPEVQRDLKDRNLGLLRKPLKAGALRAILTQYVLRRHAAE
jgi:Na+/proline symporter/signal transduction histidine kinase/CheY-like chemotaxis protein